jgi:hypothetical protein
MGIRFHLPDLAGISYLTNFFFFSEYHFAYFNDPNALKDTTEAPYNRLTNEKFKKPDREIVR